MTATNNTFRTAFNAQRRRAKHREIDWLLTFDEWMAIWEQSGKLSLRGRGTGKYVMSRHGDVGPYSVDNVTVERYEINAGDVNTNHPDKCGGTKRTGMGRGSYRVKRGSRVTYLSRFRGKYLGVFDTPEQASQAYQKAYSIFLTEK